MPRVLDHVVVVRRPPGAPVTGSATGAVQDGARSAPVEPDQVELRRGGSDRAGTVKRHLPHRQRRPASQRGGGRDEGRCKDCE